MRWRTAPGMATLLVVVAACSLTSTAGAGPVQLAGTAAPVPEEPLTELDQRAFEDVLIGFAGRGIVVNIWASWCGPCQAEAPLLRKAHEADGQAVAFIGVDSRDGRQAAAKFIDRYGIRYPNIADPSGMIAAWLGSRGLPTTLIFDASGHRKATITGALTEQVLAGQLAELKS